MVNKIISGGQTGADQAALDAAIELGIPHGGWIPKGRLTEEGQLLGKYQLQEMPTGSYTKRTEQNVVLIPWHPYLLQREAYRGLSTHTSPGQSTWKAGPVHQFGWPLSQGDRDRNDSTLA